MNQIQSMPKSVFLASTSPRRAELLAQLGITFEVVNAPVEEVALPGEQADSFVRRMAIEKALDGFNKVAGTKVWVIGGDTLVKVGDSVLTKPRNQADAMRMWRLLSGRTHQVLSAVAVVYDGEVACALNETQVSFAPMTEADMLSYWASGEPQDKTGAYAIQGLGARFIADLRGSYSAVMGLPLFELTQLLKRFAYFGGEHEQ
jgi:septum formation protein